jgi:predicted nucleotidyltransferase
MAAERAAAPLEAKIGDPVVRAALSELDRKLRARFGDRYVRLILFGSRARGDNAPDSDADVAVVLRGRIADRWSVERQIIGETYPIVLETGLYIESWPLEQNELDDPDRSSNPALLRNVLREGIRL